MGMMAGARHLSEGPRIRGTPALSMATSVPVPMATHGSARGRAGVSFILESRDTDLLSHSLLQR